VLKLSENVVEAFRLQGLKTLRQQILMGWFNRMRKTGEFVGPEGRDRILQEIELTSRAEPGLTMADLNMMADLMLVEAANDKRTRAHGR
jgi:hypothetical protein